MGVLDALWHLANFFAPALGVGVLAAGLAKLLWWRDLRTASWWRLAAWAVLASSLALVAGLLLSGHDGKMVTYGAMVLVCAIALWWAGWGAKRR
ncbi:MAG: hypothetical protein ABI605_03915 [Rhizobacter sp.]